MEGVLALMIPLSAVTLGIALAAWSLYLEHQRKLRQYEERQLMIERGMTPPPDLPRDLKAARSPESALQRGTVLVFLGIGLGIAYFLLPTDDGPPPWLAGVGGAIVGFIGLGNLVYYFIARDTATNADTAPLS